MQRALRRVLAVSVFPAALPVMMVTAVPRIPAMKPVMRVSTWHVRQQVLRMCVVVILSVQDVPICTASITLHPGDVSATPGEVVKQPVCLDNPDDLVGGIQFDLCEYVAGQPGDCLRCTDCELTARTALFDCSVFELPGGCCRVLLFSTYPGGLINPGFCDIATVVYESRGTCSDPTCAVQIPENIIAVDDMGMQLPPFGLPGDVCFLPPDRDGDGIPDGDDNCPLIPNGPEGGTCVGGYRVFCMGDGDVRVGECVQHDPGGFRWRRHRGCMCVCRGWRL